jgi:hypothetical protein
MSEPFGCDAHEGSRSTAMLLFGESHAAGTTSLPSAGSLRALQSVRDGIAVCRAHGNIPRRQSRRRDDACEAQFSFNGVEGCGPRPHNSAGRYLGFSGPERGAHIRSVQGFCRRLVRAGER